MAAPKGGPKVSAIVDEGKGSVIIGVVHEGAFLPVAEADLSVAQARGLDAKGEPEAGDDNEGEG